MSALESGAHLYLEKPFTITLAEADDILRLASSKKLRVAVAHVTRMAPGVRRLEKALREGLIGDLLEIAFRQVGLDWQDHVELDERFNRPADACDLIGDASKAHRQLGWKPKVGFEELIASMVSHDQALLKTSR